MLKLLLLSILLHIIDDFVLQPICLSKLKQKNYWFNECKKYNVDMKKYQYDYKMALFIHSLSWSLMILLPIMFLCSNFHLIVLLLFNIVCHYYIDDMKANKLKINLMTDQIFHFMQIIISYSYIMAINY